MKTVLFSWWLFYLLYFMMNALNCICQGFCIGNKPSLSFVTYTEILTLGECQSIFVYYCFGAVTWLQPYNFQD